MCPGVKHSWEPSTRTWSPAAQNEGSGTQRLPVLSGCTSRAPRCRNPGLHPRNGSPQSSPQLGAALVQSACLPLSEDGPGQWHWGKLRQVWLSGRRVIAGPAALGLCLRLLRTRRARAGPGTPPPPGILASTLGCKQGGDLVSALVRSIVLQRTDRTPQWARVLGLCSWEASSTGRRRGARP